MSDGHTPGSPYRLIGRALLRQVQRITAISTPGGRLEELVPGLYKAAALVLVGPFSLRVSAEAMLVAEREEVFPLRVDRSDPDPDWHRPPLEAVTAPPADLHLDDFFEVPLQFGVLSTREDVPDRGQGSVEVDTGLLIGAPTGRELLIESRDEPLRGARTVLVPLDLTLAADPEVVASRKQRGTLRATP